MPPSRGLHSVKGQMWCRTRVQGLASVPKREIEGCFEPEIGEKKGSRRRCCEHFEVRAGSPGEG